MNQAESKIPYIKKSDRVIIFDGKCKLCNAWCKFIITYDKRHIFKLTAMQSEKGQAILAHLKFPTDKFETMLLIDKGGIFQKSTSFLMIVSQLPFPIKMLIILKLIPVFIRDFFYDYIARNRYDFFGKYDTCILPVNTNDNRYL